MQLVRLKRDRDRQDGLILSNQFPAPLQHQEGIPKYFANDQNEMLSLFRDSCPKCHHRQLVLLIANALHFLIVLDYALRCDVRGGD